MWAVIAAAVSFLLPGLVVLILGWRGRRFDDHPVCARCRFDLVGTPEPRQRCPECGAELSRSRSVRIGNRRRTPTLLALGVILTLLGLPPAWLAVPWFNGPAWASKKPIALLEFDLLVASRQSVALDELNRRAGSGTLPKPTLTRLARRGLAIQADVSAAWNPLWGDLIQNAAAAGLLSDEEIIEFIKHAVSPNVTLSRKVRLAPSQFIFAGMALHLDRGPSTAMFKVDIRHGEIDAIIGGETVRFTDHGVGRLGLDVRNEHEPSKSWTRHELAGIPLGSHEARETVRYTIVASPISSLIGRQFTVNAPCRVTIVPADEPLAEFMTDESSRLRAESFIRLLKVGSEPADRIDPSAEGHRLTIELELSSLDTPLAGRFEFTVRSADIGRAGESPRTVNISDIALDPSSDDFSTRDGIERRWRWTAWQTLSTQDVARLGTTLLVRCRFIPDEQVASDHNLDRVYGLEIDLGEHEVQLEPLNTGEQTR